MYCKKQIKTVNNNESGIALIIVLSFLMLVALITATVVMVSQISNIGMAVNVGRGYSAYTAEGATARLQWLIMGQQSINPNGIANGPIQFNSIGQQNNNPYQPDGKPITIQYYNDTVTVEIYDMASGYNISGFSPSQSLSPINSTFFLNGNLGQQFNIVLTRMDDYVRENLGASPNGISRQQYTQLGLSPLPRSDKMQFRDEVLWIPGAIQFFEPDQNGRLSIFNIIPPNGMYFYSNQISFYSATKEEIMAQCKYSEEQAANIIAMRNQWMSSNQGSLYDFIPPDIMGTLKNNFSFNGSGYYTLIVKAKENGSLVERMLIISVQIQSNFFGNAIQYYEYQLY